jgi:hypothetical protein
MLRLVLVTLARIGWLPLVGGSVASPVVRATCVSPSVDWNEDSSKKGVIPQLSAVDVAVSEVNTGPTPSAVSCVISPVSRSSQWSVRWVGGSMSPFSFG